jgi:disulfide oxidoreductase YuzD
MRSVEFDSKSGIDVYHEIDWIADAMKNAPTEKEMKYRYVPIKSPRARKAALAMAEFMRRQVPLLINSMLDGKRRIDAIIKTRSKFIIATPPRPYQEWIYDCAKSDIIVTGAPSQRKNIMDKFESEKRAALKLKAERDRKIKLFRPTLEKLVKHGLVDGIIGRGSYFDANGYPRKGNDTDLIFLVKKITDEKRHAIFKALRLAPNSVTVGVTEGKDRTIKRGAKGSQEFSIITEDDNAVRKSLGLKYERYVLETGAGISLRNLRKNNSEKLAKEFAVLLPASDMRQKVRISRLPS